MKLHQEVAGLLETSQAPLARNTWIILGVTPSIQKHLDFFLQVPLFTSTCIILGIVCTILGIEITLQV